MKFISPRLFIVTLIVFLLASTTPVRAEHAAAAISESAYWELVSRSRENASKLKGMSELNIKQGMTQLANEWTPIIEVEMEDGHIIEVNNQYLLRSIQVKSPNIDAIIKILDALLAAHAEYPDKVFSTADLDPLHEILARKEFQWAKALPNPINEWLQKMRERFSRWFDSIFGNTEISMPLGRVFPFIASILLAVVFFIVFKTFFSDFASEARLNLDDEEESEPLTSDAAFDKAQTLSRVGDYRAAVRYLYISSLLLLDERDIMRYDRSKTNREYLRSVVNSPELAQPLSEVIEVFDNVWYGYHTLEEESFKHYSKRVEELKGKKQ